MARQFKARFVLRYDMYQSRVLIGEIGVKTVKTGPDGAPDILNWDPQII